jgi:magnesium transporter
VSSRALLFHADGADTDIDPADIASRRVKSDELLWVDLQSADPTELGTIKAALKLTDDSASVLAEIPPKPRAIVHDDGVEVATLAPNTDPDANPVPLQILLGDGWVVTHHDADIPFLAEHREAIQDRREVGRLTPVEFLVSLLDWHVDAFFHVAEQLENEVDDLDDAALGAERNDILSRLVAMRRRIARARRVIVAHREIAAELSRPDFLPESASHGAEALTAVAIRLERAGEAVANAREMLIGTFDVHMTRTAQRTNDTMRILTLASVILLPSVVLAGIMGMNFKVWLFEDPNLFWVVIGIMLAMAAATLGISRWRRWL